MLGKFLFVALLAAQSGLVGANAPAPESTVVLQWKMSVDANGSVTALNPHGASKNAISEQLEPVVRGWNFEPASADGKQASVETVLSVQLALVPSADGQSYSVRVDDVRAGGSISVLQESPRLPESEARVLKNNDGFAKLVFEVSYDESGKAIEATILPDSTNAKGRLAELAETAVRNWTYEPERVAGVPMSGKVVVPICYSVSKKKRKGTPTGKRCVWSQPGSKANVGNGESLALDSSIHLKSDVIGKML